MREGASRGAAAEPRSAGQGRRALALAAVAALVAGGVAAGRLWTAFAPRARGPLWDEAGNLWGAVELWAAAADGRLLDFLVRLNAQDKWPFGFSLLMLPFVGVGGGSLASALLLPALAFALVPALLVWAGSEAEASAGDGRLGAVAGLAAGLAWLASPLARALATVVLRETVGAALGVAVLAAYLRARRVGSASAWRVAGGLLLVLFWIKSNYFLLAGTALAVHAALEVTAESRRAWMRRLGDAVLRRGWSSPARWLALLATVAVALALVGRNPGNLLYAALLVATVAALRLLWKSRLGPREALGRLSPAARGLVVALVLPVWIWCLSPRPIHPRSLFAFLRNREGHAPLLAADSLLFYPRTLLAELTADRVAGWLLILLVATGILLLGRRSGPGRAVALTAAVGFAALVAHPLKEARFLVTVAPSILLVATLGIVRLSGIVRTSRAASWSSALVLIGLSFHGASRALAGASAEMRVGDHHRLLTADPAFARPLEAVAARVAEGTGPVALLGGVNELSESAVRWRAWRRSGSEAPLVAPLRGLEGEESAERIHSRLAGWLDRERPRRIVAVRPLSRSEIARSEDYRRWNAWQREALAALAAEPAWRAGRAQRFREAGLELTTWTRARAGEPPREGSEPPAR